MEISIFSQSCTIIVPRYFFLIFKYNLKIQFEMINLTKYQSFTSFPAQSAFLFNGFTFKYFFYTFHFFNILFVLIKFCNKIVKLFKLFNICQIWNAPILFLNIRAKVEQGAAFAKPIKTSQRLFENSFTAASTLFSTNWTADNPSSK